MRNKCGRRLSGYESFVYERQERSSLLSQLRESVYMIGVILEDLGTLTTPRAFMKSVYLRLVHRKLVVYIYRITVIEF